MDDWSMKKYQDEILVCQKLSKTLSQACRLSEHLSNPSFRKSVLTVNNRLEVYIQTLMEGWENRERV